MKKHDPITVTIDTLSHDGRGIAIINGKKTFLRGGLAQEKVQFIYTKKHRQYDEGLVTEVITPATQRVKARCHYFGICGGCNLQHLHPNEQIQHKQAVLLEQLQHFGNITPESILPPLTADLWGYRRKARLGVKYVHAKEKVLVGFREINGRYIANMESCDVLHPSIGKILPELSRLVATLSCCQQLPQIEVAIGDDVKALIFRHLQVLTENDHKLLVDFAKQHHIHCYSQSGKMDSIIKLHPQDGNDLLSYHLPTYDLQLHFHPADFTQVNHEINQIMVKQALTLLDLEKTDIVLDLFCGLGNFTLPIARYCQQVTGIEGDLRMVERAKFNANHNQLSNCEFYTSNLITCDFQQPWVKKYTKLLLDPPRSGAEAIVNHVSKFAAKRIVYVSCNPATLARDAGILQQQGYKLQTAGVMDMFPHTAHVESIALFEHKES